MQRVLVVIRIGVVLGAITSVLVGCGRSRYAPVDASSGTIPDALDVGNLDTGAADVGASDAAGCPEGASCPGGICRAGACCTGCWDAAAGRCETGAALASCGAGGRACRTCACDGDTCMAGTCRPRSSFSSVAPGNAHTCALRDGGDVVCWGSHATGQTGTGPITDATPRPPGLAISGALELSGSYEHVCARTASGVSCWGRGWEGQLGHGVPAPSGVPVVALADPNVARIDTGFVTSGAVLADGPALGWGRNDAVGMLGLGTGVGDATTPSPIPLEGVSDIGLGHTSGCVARRTGGLACFGANEVGQIGIGDPGVSQPTPASVPELAGETIVAVDGGFVHTCALDASGRVWCAGGNLDGALATGDRMNRARFTQTLGGPYDALAIGARSLHVCARDRARSDLDCWGSNARGQIAGLPATTTDRPTRIDLGPIVAFGLGTSHTCAITEGGALYCWGENADGQVDAGIPSPGPAPITRICAP
jgi:alpha-tubulin suppressor-like RCC1 family protein